MPINRAKLPKPDAHPDDDLASATFRFLNTGVADTVGAKPALDKFAQPGLSDAEAPGKKPTFFDRMIHSQGYYDKNGKPSENPDVLDTLAEGIPTTAAKLKGFTTGATEAVTPALIAQGLSLGTGIPAMAANGVIAAQGVKDATDTSKSTAERMLGGLGVVGGVAGGYSGYRAWKAGNTAVKAAANASKTTTQSGLRVALDDLAKAPKGPAPAGTLTKQADIASEIEKNPGGNIAQAIWGEKGKPTDISPSGKGPGLPIVDMEKAHQDALDIRLGEEKAADRTKLATATQESKNLNAGEKFKEKSALQDARNLNAGEKFVAQGNAQDAKNLNAAEKAKLAIATQQSRNLNAGEKAVGQLQDARAAELKAQQAQDAVDAAKANLTGPKSESVVERVQAQDPNGPGRTTLTTRFNPEPPPEVEGGDGLIQGGSAGGPPQGSSLKPTGLTREVVEKTMYTNKQVAKDASLATGADDVLKVGPRKYRVIFNPKPATSTPLADLGPAGPKTQKFDAKVNEILSKSGSVEPPPNPTIPPVEPPEASLPIEPAPVKPKGPAPAAVAPQSDIVPELDPQVYHGKLYRNKAEANAIAKAVGGTVVQNGPRAYRIKAFEPPPVTPYESPQQVVPSAPEAFRAHPEVSAASVAPEAPASTEPRVLGYGKEWSVSGHPEKFTSFGDASKFAKSLVADVSDFSGGQPIHSIEVPIPESKPPVPPVNPEAGTTGKAAKMADVQSGSDKLGELMDAIHGPDSSPRINPEGHGLMPAEPASVLPVAPKADPTVKARAAALAARKAKLSDAVLESQQKFAKVVEDAKAQNAVEAADPNNKWNQILNPNKEASPAKLPTEVITRTTPETRPILDAIASTEQGNAVVVAGGQRLPVQQSNYGMFGRAIGGDIKLADGSEISVNLVDRVEDGAGNVLWKKESSPAIPGLEGVQKAENPTPKLAEAPFTLGGQAATRTAVEPSLLGTPEAPSQPSGQPIGRKGGVIPVSASAGKVSTPADKIQFAKDNFTPEANSQLDAMGEEYRSTTDKARKRELGQQMASLDQSERARLASAAGEKIPAKNPSAPPEPTIEELQKLSPAERRKTVADMVRRFNDDQSGEMDPYLAVKLGLSGASGAIGYKEDPLGNRPLSALAMAAVPFLSPIIAEKGIPLLAQGISKSHDAVGTGLNAVNRLHNASLLSPFSIVKKAAGDIGGLSLAAFKHPDRAGSMLSQFLSPEGRQGMGAAFKEGFSGPENEAATGMENFIQKGPLGWSGKTMGGLTRATKHVLGESGFSPEEQRYFTLTDYPRYSTTENLYNAIRGNKVLQHFSPFARIGVNRLERGWEHSPLGLLDLIGTKDPEAIKNTLTNAAVGTAVGTGAYEMTPDNFVKEHPTKASLIASLGGPLGIPILAAMAMKNAHKNPGEGLQKAFLNAGEASGEIARDIPGLRLIEDASSRSMEGLVRNYLSGYTNFARPIATTMNPEEPDVSSKNLTETQRLLNRMLSNLPVVRGTLPKKGGGEFDAGSLFKK